MKHVTPLRTVLVLISVAWVTGCADSSDAPQTQKVRPAKLFEVQQASQQRELTFPAVVRAAQSAQMTFSLNGEVVELNVLEGQDIEAGHIIAKLDQRNVINDLAQARAEFQNAESEFERVRKLGEQNAISQSTIDSRQTQVEVTRAAVVRAQKALDDSVLIAPFAGTVSEVFIEQFQNVSPNEPVITLQSAETEAVINVPSSIIARTPQLEPLETRVILDAAPDLAITAEFREASGVADASSQTFEVSFTFELPENFLVLPGMTGTVAAIFLFDEGNDVLRAGYSVPISAILAEGEARYVWVVNEDMTISRQAVQLAPVITEQATIIDGLEGGETVVAAGVTFFHEGMTVRPWDPSAL